MGARILVIEDNPANLELMRYVLEAFGHTVSTAVDGQEGLDAARRERPELIVCDLQLPRVDGFEVARQLKANSAFSRIPLIAVTAFAMVGDRDRVLAAGFDGYIAKPIEPQSFIAQIDTFLDHGQRAAAPMGAAPENAPDAAATTAATAVTKRTEGRGKHVLIVDDTHANLHLLSTILSSASYEVSVAENLTEARALAGEQPPDLIISDFHIRNERGMDFIDWVHAQPGLAAVPFMFISSTVRAEIDRKAALERGADRFVLRPIEPQALLDEIEGCIKRGRK